MTVPSPRSQPPDGALICRVDGTGRRIAILPATCKAGTHPITVTDHGAIVSAGEILLSCPTCAATPGVDHSWRLTIAGPTPDLAELDDQRYGHLRSHPARPARIRTGR